MGVRTGDLYASARDIVQLHLRIFVHSISTSLLAIVQPALAS
jgi:hypothetical protein